MNTFDPGPGWTPEDISDEAHAVYELAQYGDDGELIAAWSRDTPVPPLPTEPYSVIRVTWKPLDARKTYDFVRLDGLWRNKHGEALEPDEVQSFEVLAEPRAVTAKAVLDGIASEPWAREIDLSKWATEFGVQR